MQFIKEPTKRMKTYSRLTKRIEDLVCVILLLLSRRTKTSFIDEATPHPNEGIWSGVICRY